jgi:hypothetical protein
MNRAGSFDLFADAFPTRLLPAVFALILEEWPLSPRPEGNPIENRISNRFVGHLNTAMRKRKLPLFKFLPRPKLADADSDSEAGEVDIYVDSFSRHPDAYFVFECKRLNVMYESGIRSDAAKYVGATGMGCFVSGQYPATCDCGGMLGYVMDGNVLLATIAVNRALKRHHRQLRLRLPRELEQATIFPDDPAVRQTRHDRNRHEFVVYHIMLPY